MLVYYEASENGNFNIYSCSKEEVLSIEHKFELRPALHFRGNIQNKYKNVPDGAKELHKGRRDY